MHRILVVEDEELVRTMILINLERENFTIKSCESAEEMLEILDKEKMDLILLDIMLPGMNGEDALKELRRRGVQTPVIMVTAKNTIDTKVNSLGKGADDFISKPFNIQELSARIKAVIRRNQSNPSLEINHKGEA